MAALTSLRNLSVTNAVIAQLLNTSDVIRQEVHKYEDAMYRAEVDQLRNGTLEYGQLYGLGLPVMAGLGMLGNLVTFVMFRLARVHTLSTLLIDALLISDSAFLLAFTLSTAPGAVLIGTFEHVKWDAFKQWTSLDFVQVMFLGTQSIYKLTYSLTLWYLVAMLMEQYAVHHYPTALSRIDNIDNGVKVIVTIFSVVFISQMLAFFKFERRDVMYGFHTKQKKVCLSESYRSYTSLIYDYYISFALIQVLPVCLGIYLLYRSISQCVREALTPRRPSAAVEWEMDNDEMARIFNGVRSVKLVIVLGVFLLTCHTITCVLYGISVERLTGRPEDHYLSARCRLIPIELRLDFANQREIIYAMHIFQVAPAFLKAFLIYFSFDEMRYCLHQYWITRRDSAASMT